ncbi:MAG: hypothetical protein AB1489_42815, partial [Acidobacteriota bacterium]
SLIGGTPIVVEPEETDLNAPRMVAYNFFQKVEPGDHVVEIMVAAGSGIASGNEPSIYNAVLQIHHQ